MEKVEVSGEASGEASGRSASAKLEEIATISSCSANDPPGTVVGASQAFGDTVPKNAEESSSESDNGMPTAGGESSAGEFVAKDASKADSSASSNSSQNEEPNNDDSSGNRKPKKKKPKLDRSKLRKGKWSVSLFLVFPSCDISLLATAPRRFFASQTRLTTSFVLASRSTGRRRRVYIAYHSLLQHGSPDFA